MTLRHAFYSLLMVAVLWLPGRAEFELARPGRAATIFVLPTEPECVRLAANDLASDVGKITGQQPRIVARLEECATNCVVVGSLAHSESALNRLPANTTAALRGQWEAYRVEIIPSAKTSNLLLIAGSDERGAMFGVYAFSEQYLGVDPLYFWTDREPAKRQRLAWPRVSITGKEPTFRYRGWFINDEDLLTEWKDGGGKRHIEYPFYHQVPAPEVHERIFEALLRLQYNLVIPSSFNDIANPDERRMIEQAVRRGLFVSTHHVEPLGVSAFAFQNYWRLRGRNVPFSFVNQRQEFAEVWRYYAGLWARFGDRVIWQIGLRGIADRPVWISDPNVPPTDAGRGELISDAMRQQMEIIRQVDKRPQPPVTTTLWMEGADLNRKGFLKFPAGVMVIFSDNSPGWRLQPDFYETPREAGRAYGIYYHHAVWAQGPHFVQGASPHKTHEIFKLAVTRGSHSYAILNVANVREVVLGVDASARMLRDFAWFDPDRYLRQWCNERFGAAAEKAEQAYRRFFASYVIDERVGYPALLDGRTIHTGERTWARLLSRAAGVGAANTEDFQLLMTWIEKQRGSLRESARLAAAARDEMRPADRVFFETNLIAQQTMLLGLLGWLEAGIKATQAYEKKDQAELAAQVRAGQAALKDVRTGQALATRGKWRDWYRGDRKMNLHQAEGLSRQAIEMLIEK